MNREVQRTFVLLRQLGSGRESGYARAETRDGSVKLNLVVQGFGRNAAPYAFGLTQEGLLPLGALNMDARGQGGISIPEQVRVLGRDDTLFARYNLKRLSSIRDPLESFCDLAIDSLVSMMEGQKPEKNHYVLQGRVIRRETT